MKRGYITIYEYYFDGEGYRRARVRFKAPCTKESQKKKLEQHFRTILGPLFAALIWINP